MLVIRTLFIALFFGICATVLSGCATPEQEAQARVDQEIEARTEARNKSMSYLKRAYVLSRQENWKDCEEESLKSIGQDPRNYPAWMLLGASRYHLEKYLEAATAYDQACRLEPSAAEPRMNMGMVLESSGLYYNAIDQYQIAIKLNPNDLHVRENLARALFRVGKLEEAKRVIRTEDLATEKRQDWSDWLKRLTE